MMRYHGKHLDALDCTAFSCHKEETEQSSGARCVFFYFSNTGLSNPLLLVVKKTFGGKGSCVIFSMSIYVFEGQYDSFPSFGLM